MKKIQINIIIGVLFFYSQTNVIAYNDCVRSPFYQNEEYLFYKDKEPPFLKIGYLKHIKGVKCFNNLPLYQGQEQVIVLKPVNNAIINSFVQKVEFPFGKSKFYNKTDRLYKNVHVFVKINIYNVEDNLPGKKIFSSEPVAFLMSKKGSVSVDIAEKGVILPQEGLCFGIEMIGEMDENGETIENERVHARPLLTAQSLEDYSTITYRTNTYRTNRIDSDSQVKYRSINDSMGIVPDLPKCTIENFNLAIGIVLRKP